MSATTYYSYNSALAPPSTTPARDANGNTTTLASIFYDKQQQACVGLNLDCIGSNSPACNNVDKRTGELKVENWMREWSPKCIDLYGNIINGYIPNTSSVKRDFSLNGLAVTQLDFQYMFSRLYNTSTSYKFTDAGKSGYDQFEAVLLDACRQLPGACQPVQNHMCGYEAGNLINRDHISPSQALVSLCGCVAPSLSKVYGSQYDGISPACDPLCSQQLSIKPIVGDPASPTYIAAAAVDSNYKTNIKSASDYGLASECQATLCILDNNTITASDSTTGGTSFTQVCPSCALDPGAQCKCIVNFTPSSVNDVQKSNLINEVTFNQYCPGALCLLADDASQELKVVPCGDHLTTTTDVPAPTKSSFSGYLKYLPLLFVLLIFIIGFCVLFVDKKKVIGYASIINPDMTLGVGPNGELSSLYIPRYNH
jgi:hypothetical protein